MVTMIPVTKLQIWWAVRRLFITMVDSIFHYLINNAVAAGSSTKRHKTRHVHHSNQGRQLDHPKINVQHLCGRIFLKCKSSAEKSRINSIQNMHFIKLAHHFNYMEKKYSPCSLIRESIICGTACSRSVRMQEKLEHSGTQPSLHCHLPVQGAHGS